MTTATSTTTRLAIYRAFAAVHPHAVHTARWRVGTAMWEVIRADDTMRCDWLQTRGVPARRIMLGLPVDLDTDDPQRCELTVPVFGRRH